MDIIVFLGVMIEWPWLALVPACAFALAWVRCRRASVLVAALAWLAYFAYELGIWLRVLCTGECGPVSATGALTPVLRWPQG